MVKNFHFRNFNCAVIKIAVIFKRSSVHCYLNYSEKKLILLFQTKSIEKEKYSFVL